MNTVTFFLSTGRCGTQLIAKALGRTYQDLAVVEHEPLKFGYRSRQFFRKYDQCTEILKIPEVKNHVERIHQILQSGSYIEVGWYGYGAIPVLYQEFGKSFRLIQLVRHPVYTAFSLATHDYYHPLYKDWERLKNSQLEPSDPGIVQQHYREVWDKLTQYEKCLFLWTELHLYGGELLLRFPEMSFYLLRFESLLTDQKKIASEMLNFLRLPFRSEFLQNLGEKVDRHHLQSDSEYKWDLVFRHIKTIQLAEEFGYSFEGLTNKELRERYYIKKILPRLQRKILHWRVRIGEIRSNLLALLRN